jgi:hypothetical protein
MFLGVKKIGQQLRRIVGVIGKPNAMIIQLDECSWTNFSNAGLITIKG